MNRSAGVEGLGSLKPLPPVLVPRVPAAAASSDHGTASARSSGIPNPASLSPGLGVDDGFALPVIHPLSMTRRGLLALERVNQRVLAQESERFTSTAPTSVGLLSHP